MRGRGTNLRTYIEYHKSGIYSVLNWMGFLFCSLFEEIKTHYGFDMTIPSSDSQLVNDLSKWLRMAGARSKVVIVFDALNQLDDGSGQDGECPFNTHGFSFANEAFLLKYATRVHA